jgi:hypothetical protein
MVLLLSVSLISTGRPSWREPRATSSSTEIDDLQNTLAEGPCLAAASGDCDLIRIDDLRSDARFPHFAP